MAAVRTIEDMLSLAPDRYRITVFGAERHGHYNRILLSAVLAGDTAMEEIVTHPASWYARNGIILHEGDPVTAIDTVGHTLSSASGKVVAWDRLILATGAVPVLPAIPGIGLEGVCTFRDMSDVGRMIRAAEQHRRAVVIGGGVLGLEAAWGLKQRGMEVSVVHLMPALMDRQLDDIAAGLLRQDLDGRGIASITGTQAVAILGDGRVSGVLLSEGASWRPIWWWSRSGFARKRRSPGRPGWRLDAGLWWPTTCAPLTPTSMPWANASSTTANASGWWRRSGTWPASAPTTWPTSRKSAASSRLLYRPASRSPASASFPPVVSPPPTTANANSSITIPEKRVYRKLVLCGGKVVGAVLYSDSAAAAASWNGCGPGPTLATTATAADS